MIENIYFVYQKYYYFKVCMLLDLIVRPKRKKKFQSIYATDLDYLLDVNFVQTWICGHVHKNFDFVSDKGCRLVGNQKGKIKDKITDYKSNFLLQF